MVETSFIEEKLESLQRIKGFIDSLTNVKTKNILMLAYLSIIENASIRVKDGNGLKLKKNKKQIENIYDYFLSKCFQMLDDINVTSYSKETKHMFLRFFAAIIAYVLIISNVSASVNVGLAVLPCRVGHAFCHATLPTTIHALLTFL